MSKNIGELSTGAPARRISSRRFTGALRVLAVAALAAGVAAPLVPSAPAEAALRTPTAAVKLPKAVDAVARYDSASICSPTAKPGATRLMRELLETYPASRSLGISRACGAGGKSEHKEGRAIDWGVRAWVPAEAANASSFIKWALAKDSNGNAFANARRLGIMYMIWNDRIWVASNASAGWRSYKHPACRTIAGCGATLRHRDHVHISLSWAGAKAQTSFWSGQVAGSGSAPAPSTATPVRIATSKSVSTYRNTTLKVGSRGTAVAALQKALRMSQVTGNFGPLTKAAVVRYQRPRDLPATGTVGPKTWAKLATELAGDSKRIAKVDHLVVKAGATGARAQVLEAALNRKIDGKYTKADVAAVKVFQRTHGVPATGVVAKLTWAALRGI